MTDKQPIPAEAIPAQERIFDVLGNPATHGGQDVMRLDTHGAAVFLAGGLAYKIKKAVRFPFLDFSTLDLRRRACVAEVELNRRTAPGIYLGLGAVVADEDGRLALSGPGEEITGRPIEWLVVMRRFDQECLLDRIAARGDLTPALMRDLADAVAAFHEEAEPRPDGAGAAAMRNIAVGVIERLQAFPDIFPERQVRRLSAVLAGALERHAQLMDRRRDAGRVRHCHGDLHLRNIVLQDGRPVPFDCIEFDEAYAICDVLYDLAFLLMDLEHRRLRPLANALFNRYLERSGDAAGLALLPLFLGIRAGIRAHITATMAAGKGKAEEAAELRQEALSYLDLALRVAEPGQAGLIAIGGLSGTGKTTLARLLAPGTGPAPGAVVLRSDVLRKRMLGVDELARLGPEGYGEVVTGRVYAEMAALAGQVLDSGHAVICDGVYARPEQRAAIGEVARAVGRPFTGLWLRAEQSTQLARVEARTGDASDATADIVRLQAGFDLGGMDWRVLSAEGPSEEVAEAARRLLPEERGRAGAALDARQ